jgi:hypothetical protein
MKIYLLIMIVNHFPKIVKDILNNTSDSFGRESRSTVLKKVSGIRPQKTEKKAFFRLSSKNTRT